MIALLPFLFFGLVNAQIPSLNITIATLPTFSTCKPATINWSGGSAPFRVYIYPDNWTNVTDWLIELPITTRPSTIWNVNLAAGTGVVVNIWDGVNDQYSEPSWIQDSGDNACLVSNGIFQSSSGSASTTTGLEQPTSIASTSSSTTFRVVPSVVSTPSQAITRSQNGPASSVASSAVPPPGTVTVIQGNGAIGVNRQGIWGVSSTFLIGWIALWVL